MISYFRSDIRSEDIKIFFRLVLAVINIFSNPSLSNEVPLNGVIFNLGSLAFKALAAASMSNFLSVRRNSALCYFFLLLLSAQFLLALSFRLPIPNVSQFRRRFPSVLPTVFRSRCLLTETRVGRRKNFKYISSSRVVK